MIEWSVVAFNSIWLLGLSLVCAAVSMWDYQRRTAGLSVKTSWRGLLTHAWLWLGTLLVCLGRALTSTSWIESGLWCCLGLYVAYGWRTYGRAAWAPPSNGRERLARPSEGGASLAPWRAAARRVAGWIVRTELLWLALLAPFFVFPAPGRVLPLLGLPALWIARRVARGRYLPATPLDGALAILLLMVLVSLYATFDMGFSLGKIAGVLFGIGVYYALVEWASSGRRLRWAVGAYLVAGVALTVAGLFGANEVHKVAILSRWIPQLPPVLRGLPGAESGVNTNEVAGALLWVVPVQLAFLGWSGTAGAREATLRAQWLLRGGLALALAISGGTLLLMQSRSALAGCGLAVGLLLLLAVPRARWIVPIVLAAALAAAVVVGPQALASRVVDMAGSGASAPGQPLTVADRFEIWSRGIDGVEDFPFTGMGMNAFRRVMPVLYPLFVVGTDLDLAHAHNQFLQAALDLGLPGLVAYLALWLLAAALVVQLWRAATDRLSRALAGGVGAAGLAYFVYGLTDTVALGAKPGIFFWALLAILVAGWQQATTNSAVIPADVAAPVPLPVEPDLAVARLWHHGRSVRRPS